jgi:hypothetical protein
MSLVGNLNLAKEYAPRAETNMGMTVEGMVTTSEFNRALLRGAVGWFQAPRKPLSVGLKTSKFHQPFKISGKGLIDAMNTPKNGIIQTSETVHAMIWVKIVNFFTSLSLETMLNRLNFSPSF